jgi:acetylornithine deacetylase
VEAPTVLGNEEPGQEIMRDAFRELGLDPVDVPLDPAVLRAHTGSSPFSWDVAGKTNVVATWAGAGGEGRSLILNGHVDVVPPAAESLWRTAPFRATRDGDWLYGRGSGDMKAGLAAIVGAVRGLRRLGVAPRAPVHLQSVVEEECTGNGALQCVLAGPLADAAILTEPFPGQITTSQVGVLWFRVELAGAPAHARAAQSGVNAIEAAFPIVQALRALEDELNADPPAPYDAFAHPINLNVGTIRGGDWPSTVASECTLALRLAHYPGQPVAGLKQRVEAAVAAAAARNGFLASSPPRVIYDGLACEGSEVSAEDPLVETLARAHERLAGRRPELVASTATTDARAFVGAGIPAVCFGPHAENIHGVDERVSLPSMVQTAQTLGLFIRDWCGLAGSETARRDTLRAG